MPFTRLDQATDADRQLNREVRRRDADRPERELLVILRALDDVRNASPVSILTHSLQTATRAERDGAAPEMVFAALCHDLGQLFTPVDHGAVSAALVGPYVSRRTRWVVRVHADFTERYRGGRSRDYARLRHRLHPGYSDACRFVDAWDQVSFDPAYDTEPLEHFEPLVRARVRSVKRVRSLPDRAVRSVKKRLHRLLRR